MHSIGEHPQGFGCSQATTDVWSGLCTLVKIHQSSQRDEREGGQVSISFGVDASRSMSLAVGGTASPRRSSARLPEVKPV